MFRVPEVFYVNEFSLFTKFACGTHSPQDDGGSDLSNWA
jgi:hypothetical protein